MNEHKNKKPTRVFDWQAFETEWEFQIGSLMLKNENEGREWKKEVAKHFVRWQFEKDSEEILRLEAKFLEAIINVKASYPTDIFPEDGKSIDCLSARMARKTCDNILAKFEELKNEQ